MDLLKVIQSASSPADIELLLKAMGQSSMPTAQPIYAPRNPQDQAVAEFFAQDLRNIQSEEAARVLLNSMGQTGVYSERIPMSPQTSAGIPQPAASAEEAPTIQGASAQEKSQPNQAGWEAFLNAKTGEDRVNALTNEHGVRAVRDPATGRVTLTNLDESGKPTEQSQKQIYGWNPKDAPGKGETNTFAPTDPVARNNIDQIMDQIAKAEDSATAEGLIRGLNSAVAEEKVRLEQQAFKFAEEELGIPQLRDAVEALKRRDASQGMVNGIPYVSKEYLDATNQLSQRQAAANQRANEWLTRNISWNRLGATEASAKVLLERKVTKLGAAEAKETEKQQRYGAVFESIPESQRELIYRVNPAIKDKPEETVKFIERAKNDKEFMAFVNSAAHERIGLALSGNNYALRYVVEEEAAKTGKPIQQVERELLDFTKMEPNDRMLKEFIEANAGSLSNAEERKSTVNQQLAAIAQSKIATTEKGKELYSAIKPQIIARAIATTKTDRYIRDVSSWGLQDPELQAAITKARETTGEASLDKVVVAFLEGKEGPAELQGIQALRAKLKELIRKESKSLFGSPDEAILYNVINNAVMDKGSLANWIRQKAGISTYTAPSVDPVSNRYMWTPAKLEE